MVYQLCVPFVSGRHVPPTPSNPSIRIFPHPHHLPPPTGCVPIPHLSAREGITGVADDYWGKRPNQSSPWREGEKKQNKNNAFVTRLPTTCNLSRSLAERGWESKREERGREEKKRNTKKRKETKGKYNRLSGFQTCLWELTSGRDREARSQWCTTP